MFDASKNGVDWSKVERFQEKEFAPKDWYQGYRVPMNSSFVDHLDRFVILNFPNNSFIIHKPNGGYATEGHSDESLHYLGAAVDGHVKGKGCVEVAVDAWRHSGFSIGIYPWWNTPGVHLDARYLKGMPRVFWFRDQDGKYHYSNEFPDLLQKLFERIKKTAEPVQA